MLAAARPPAWPPAGDPAAAIAYGAVEVAGFIRMALCRGHLRHPIQHTATGASELGAAAPPLAVLP